VGERVQALAAGMGPYTLAVLTEGQCLGAVRRDLPIELLAALATGLGEAADLWLLSHFPSLSPPELTRIVDGVFAAIRRLLEP
jgi:hypothetical protein